MLIKLFLYSQFVAINFGVAKTNALVTKSLTQGAVEVWDWCCFEAAKVKELFALAAKHHRIQFAISSIFTTFEIPPHSTTHLFARTPLITHCDRTAKSWPGWGGAYFKNLCIRNRADQRRALSDSWPGHDSEKSVSLKCTQCEINF